MAPTSEVAVQPDRGDSAPCRFDPLYRLLKETAPEKDFHDGSPDWRMEEDLHIYGDDAFDFLLRLSEQFQVDISDFDFGAHFAPEGHFTFMLRKLLRRKRELLPSPSIEDLKRAIIGGALR